MGPKHIDAQMRLVLADQSWTANVILSLRTSSHMICLLRGCKGRVPADDTYTHGGPNGLHGMSLMDFMCLLAAAGKVSEIMMHPRTVRLKASVFSGSLLYSLMDALACMPQEKCNVIQDA